MSRALYRLLLWLHPPAFRREFAAEMLWIFDEVRESHSQRSAPEPLVWPESAALLADAGVSLVRQWASGYSFWRVAAGAIGGVVEMSIALTLLPVTKDFFGYAQALVLVAAGIVLFAACLRMCEAASDSPPASVLPRPGHLSLIQ